MHRRKLRPIEEGGQAEQLRVVRSGRTVFMCPPRPRRQRRGLTRWLGEAAAILRRLASSGSHAA